MHLLNVANARERLFLPSQAMFWTSTAYVLWDEADPAWLDHDQQEALKDWLHWGGQLVISGPTTLDGLRDSFLAPYLPADATANITLAQEDLKPLHTAVDDQLLENSKRRLKIKKIALAFSPVTSMKKIENSAKLSMKRIKQISKKTISIKSY